MTKYRVLMDGNSIYYVQTKPSWCPIWFTAKDYYYGTSETKKFATQDEAQFYIDNQIAKALRERRSRNRFPVSPVTCG